MSDAAPQVEASAPAAEAPKAPTAAEVRKLKVKVEGKDSELPEEEVVAGYQLAATSRKRLEEAAHYKKQADAAYEKLRTNPMEVLADPSVLGPKAKEIIEKYLWEQYQDEALSPEAKAQKAKDAELEKYRKIEADKAKEEMTKAEKVKYDRYEQQQDQVIGKALETAGIPRSEDSVAMMAEYMINAIENGYELSPEEVVQVMKQDLVSNSKQILGHLSGEQLVEFLGDEIAKKIREADLKKLTSTQAARFTQPAPKANLTKKSEAPKLSAKAWMEDLNANWPGKK